MDFSTNFQEDINRKSRQIKLLKKGEIRKVDY